MNKGLLNDNVLLYLVAGIEVKAGMRTESASNLVRFKKPVICIFNSAGIEIFKDAPADIWI